MNRNLRHYSRIRSEFDIQLFSAGESSVEAKIQNLSRAGLMITVNRQDMEHLIPNIPVVSPKHPVTLQAVFSLSSAENGETSIHVDCDVMYARRLSRDQFQLGMSFKSFSPKNSLMLNRYIDKEQHSA